MEDRAGNIDDEAKPLHFRVPDPWLPDPLPPDLLLHYDRILTVAVIFQPAVDLIITLLLIEPQGALIGTPQAQAHPACLQLTLTCLQQLRSISFTAVVGMHAYTGDPAEILASAPITDYKTSDVVP